MGRRTVGVDVGTKNVKFVCLETSKNGHSLVAHALFDRQEVQQIKQALHHPAIRSSEIRVAIQDPAIKIQKIDVPPVPQDELEEVIKWSLKDVLGGSFDSYLVRYQLLDKKPGAIDTPYLVFAIEKEKIDKFREQLRGMGIAKPTIIEPHFYAFIRCIDYNEGLTEEESYAVVDFGKSAATFAVVSSTRMRFSRALPGAAAGSLTTQISRDLGVNEAEAERLQIGPVSGLREDQVLTLKNTLNNYLSKLNTEIQISVDSYHVQFPRLPITRLHLAGGGAKLEGLQAHLQKSLGLPTDFVAPFKKIDTKKFLSDDLDRQAIYYAVATGLAL